MTISALLLAAAATLTSGNIATINADASGMIGGMLMPDQWGNPWIEVSAYDKKRAVVKYYGCNGNAENIGEVPLASLGSENNFRGFRPYQNATMYQLEAVYLQSQFERDCLAAGKAGHACGPNPQRSDCRVMEVPSGGGNMIHKEAADWFNAAHPERKK